MFVDEVAVEEEEAPRDISPWRLALLHVSFYALCLVTTVGLRSPPWLLLALLYCGLHRTALTGRTPYPRVFCKAVLCCSVASLFCFVVINTLSLLLLSGGVNVFIWINLRHLWEFLGVPRWSTDEWLQNIVLPSIVYVAFGAYVLSMQRLDARAGVRARRSDADTASALEQDNALQRWPRLVAWCRVAAAPLLAVCAWAVAWTAPPTYVGLCVEMTAFLFLPFALHCLHRRLRLDASFVSPRGADPTTTTTTAAHLMAKVFRIIVALLLVVVCASHNNFMVAWFPYKFTHDNNLGLGYIALLTGTGVRRAVQLLGMVALVAGAAVVEAYVMPRPATARDERRGLLAVAVVEEAADEEREASREVEGERNFTPDAARNGEIGGREGRAESEASDHHHQQQPHTTSVTNDPLFAVPAAPSHDVRDFLLLRRRHVSQVVAIASVMLLLLHAVYFPSLVSVALWLVHLCCCAGGLVHAPRQPPAALCWVLIICFGLLSTAIVTQYTCLVLLADLGTWSWAWPPALPYHRIDAGAVAAQVIGEHGIALLLGLYLCTRSFRTAASSTADNNGLTPTSATAAAIAARESVGEAARSADDSDAAALSLRARTPSPPSTTPQHQQQHPVREGVEAERLEEGGSTRNTDAPYHTWMLLQLRDAAGSLKALRTLFETAVGRSPRSAELEPLIAASHSFTAPSSPTTTMAAAVPAAAAVRPLTPREIFDFIAAGPLYTYAIVISLFVLGTSGASMDALHATCLVLSLLFSIVGSNAVLYRRLRLLPPLWVAVLMGWNLLKRVQAAEHEWDSTSSPMPTTTTAPPSLQRTSVRALWGLEELRLPAAEWQEVMPYLAVQLVLLWCFRYEPRRLTDWSQVCRCLVFRCRWAHLFRFVHRAAGFVVLLWMVLRLPRSVNVTVLVLLLFSAALLHHLRWYGLAYVWRRYCIVGYCGVVLLGMLLVEFAAMQPRLWRGLRALGCPAGEEGRCARDVGLPSDTTVWLTPLSLPWWFVIVLATASGTPHALPTNLPSESDSVFATSTAATSPALTGPPGVTPPRTAAAAACTPPHRWRAWCAQWWSQLRSTLLTVLLLLTMTYAALHHPSLLTALYLVGPVWGISPIWTFSVAALHTGLQCVYQFWFSPPWLDTCTLWGTPVAQLIGLWKATVATAATAAAAGKAADDGPSTMVVAAAPLLIGLLQALQQNQLPVATADRDASQSTEEDAVEVDIRDMTEPRPSSNLLPGGEALRRLGASHLYVLLLLCLLHATQRFVLGGGVALLLCVVWCTADLRECGVLLRPRWLYRLCATATACAALLSYLLHWASRCFPQRSAAQRWPWLVGSGDDVSLFTSCWTGAAACVALQWSSGGSSASAAPGATFRGRSTEGESLFTHPHSANFITWLQHRIGRHRGTYGIRSEHSIAEFTPSQRDAFLADAAELLDTHRSADRNGGAIGEERVEGGEGGGEGEHEAVTSAPSEHASLSRAPTAAAYATAPCQLHVWSVPVLQVARLVPLAACGFVAVGATAPSCLVSIAVLFTGLLMALRHTRLQWTFWDWWRSLLVMCAALPLSALTLNCPPVQGAVRTLPPWIGLVIGLSTTNTTITTASRGVTPAVSAAQERALGVSGDGLRFTAAHVALFFALWLQSCLYNNPQWGVRLLRLQFAEQQRGAARHAALQRQWVVRVTRAMAEAARVDREVRAYLDGLRAGEDVAGLSVTSEHDDVQGGSQRAAAASAGASNAQQRENERRDDALRRLSSYDAEMILRPPSPQPHQQEPQPETPTDGRDGDGADDYNAFFFPRSPAVPTITVTGAEGREWVPVPTTNAAAAHNDASSQWYPPPGMRSARLASSSCSSAWRWWRRHCDRALRRTCNFLADYTYHPAEYRVSLAAAHVLDSATSSTAEQGTVEHHNNSMSGSSTRHASASLGRLAAHVAATAVQVFLRHTPLALLVCTLANALTTGCLWELLGLCYVVQVALAYHPYAPRLVFHGFGLYVVAGVLLKQLVMLWGAFDTANPVPAFVAGTLLPLRRGSTYPWSSIAAARDSLRYDSLWLDVVTLAVVVLHERVCLMHGVYVETRKGGAVLNGAARPRHTPPAPAVSPTAATTTVHERGNVAQNSNNESSHTAATSSTQVGSPNEHNGGSRRGTAAPSPPPPSASSVGVTAAAAATATAPQMPFGSLLSTSQSATGGHGIRGVVASYYANIVSVPGVGEDWYISYTSVDLLALFVLAVTYSRMTANEKLTLQDNVQNNQLPGPMALLLCMSVLQLVVDRMFYVQRCMRLKAAANGAAALVYCLLYWWWRNTVAVSARGPGNVYFTLKMVALVLSVTQVCRGFPLHRRRDAFTTHPGSLWRYSCFMVYRAIPFLWEVRTLIDWTVQHTALTLQEYLTLEDVYVYMYHCRERYVGKRNEHAKVGDAVTQMTKWLFGVSRLALILLALLGPLLYYSTYNPSTVVNKATQLNLELSFFGAHDFFATTVHDNATTPDGWWTWLARTRPTVALYGQAATEQTVQLMEFTSCSSSQWMASPQAMRQVLAGLRAAAAGVATTSTGSPTGSQPDGGGGEDADQETSAYILQSMEMTRSASAATSTTAVSLVRRWPMPKTTAEALVRILERETGVSTSSSAPPRTNASSSSDSGSGSGSNAPDTTTTAVLPFFYSPFAFNRASRLDLLPTDSHAPRRNQQHCTLELHHERDQALHTMVRYWCLHCAPLFPAGNVPSANTSSAAEWRCLTTGEGCDDFNYETLNSTTRTVHLKGTKTHQRRVARAASEAEVPIYMVVLSDSVVVGISFLKGIGIVALYTTFVLALGRLLRSVLSNKVSTLVFENMANPAVLENMVRCIGVAREYGDLRLEHTIYLELIDLLRSPERLFEVTGSLRCLFVDAGQDDVFRLGQVRRRGVRRDGESNAAAAATSATVANTANTSSALVAPGGGAGGVSGGTRQRRETDSSMPNNKLE